MKIKSSQLANPSIIYLMAWVPLIFLSKLNMLIFSVQADPMIEGFLFLLVINFLFLNFIVHLIFVEKFTKPADVFSGEVEALRKFVILLFKFWILGFLINVIFSGGLPIFWVLAGDVRRYADFGVPTFSGFLNMIRMFMIIASMICFCQKKFVPSYIVYFLVFSFCAELNRASILFALLGASAAFLIFNKVTIKNFIKLILASALFIVSFSFIAEFREQGRGGYSDPGQYFVNGSSETGASSYVALYFLTPLNNLYYQYELGMDPSYTPYFTLRSIVPTVIRERLFADQKVRSVELASDAFNTSPYLANIISDFGVGGAYFVISLIHFLCMFVFFRAKRGSLEHMLVHCILWGATLIGVFTNLYFSLIVLLFPALVIVFSRYKRLHMVNNAKLHFV